MNRKNGFALIAVLSILALGASALFFVNQGSPNKTSQPETGFKDSLLPTSTASPAPFPFQEITIPYLRSRSYNSSLGVLSKNSQNSSFESFTTYYDSDGLRVNGQLTRPVGEMPIGGWPAIVFVHGYIPPKQYTTLGKYNDYVNYLGRQGFVVFKIDLRGHGDSEGEAGGGYYSSDYVVDVLNARAALQKADFVNPEQVGIWGHSMAGNVAFRSLVSQPDIPAIVIWAGAVYSYSDFREYGIDDNSYQPPGTESESQKKRRELFEKYGQFDPESEFWKQVAPTNYLDGVNGSVQVHHAINDEVVSIEYSRNLMRLLDSTSIPHELYEYSDGGHNMVGSSFNQAMQRTVEFFYKNLDSK